MGRHTDTTRTRPSCPRVALVFDFDDTLAPDTWDGLLRHLDLDPHVFDAEHVDPRVRDGWDEIPARFYALITASARRSQPITRELIESYGRNLRPYDGVPGMFGEIRECARRVHPGIDVEFYIVSSGFADIIRASSVAREFDGIWGCDFHFDEQGRVAFPKTILEHTEKPRFLHLIEKGVEAYRDRPAYEVFRHLPEEELHVPLDQMIYVGDGSSDVACFALLGAHHGVALGVNKPGTPVHWGQDGVDHAERLENIAPPDYRSGSEMLRSLLLAVDSICSRVALEDLPDEEDGAHDEARADTPA